MVLELRAFSRWSALYVRYKDAEGKWRVVGGPGLKGTQSYTAEFGRGLALWCLEHGQAAAKAGTDAELGLNEPALCILLRGLSVLAPSLRLAQETKAAVVHDKKR